MCTIGPSRPSGTAVETTSVIPTTFATSEERESMPPRMEVPLRNDLSLGKPDMIAMGRWRARTAAMRMMLQLRPAYLQWRGGEGVGWSLQLRTLFVRSVAGVRT